MFSNTFFSDIRKKTDTQSSTRKVLFVTFCRTKIAIFGKIFDKKNGNFENFRQYFVVFGHLPKEHFSMILWVFELQLLEFHTGINEHDGNSSRRSSNPFRSDIDRSWFDMVYALLVPGRVNIPIS